jgi:hypothetical protein
MDNYWVALLFLSFGVGYLCGRLDSLFDRLKAQSGARPAQSFFKGYSRPQPDVPTPRADIQLDTSKFVTAVSTSGLVKSEDVQLGVTETKPDDIAAAANRLAQLKRN